jgi:hypothetical protein
MDFTDKLLDASNLELEIPRKETHVQLLNNVPLLKITTIDKLSVKTLQSASTNQDINSKSSTTNSLSSTNQVLLPLSGYNIVPTNKQVLFPHLSDNVVVDATTTINKPKCKDETNICDSTQKPISQDTILTSPKEPSAREQIPVIGNKIDDLLASGGKTTNIEQNENTWIGFNNVLNLGHLQIQLKNTIDNHLHDFLNFIKGNFESNGCKLFLAANTLLQVLDNFKALHYITNESQMNTIDLKGQTKGLIGEGNMYDENNKTFAMLKSPNYPRYRKWTEAQIERLHEYFKSKKKPRKDEYKIIGNEMYSLHQGLEFDPDMKGYYTRKTKMWFTIQRYALKKSKKCFV